MTLTRRSVLGWGVAVLACPSPAVAAERTQTLFVIARNTNANVVHYAVRLNGGKLDIDDPMVAYWVMRAEDGRREGLTWLENQVAYGYRISSRVTNVGFGLLLKAFSKRELAVRRDSEGSYRAYVRIDGQKAALDRIFVTLGEGGLKPSVRHVDLFGTASAVGKRVSERLVP